jgi:hypothetical protein
MIRISIALALALVSCQRVSAPGNNPALAVQIDDLRPFSDYDLSFEEINEMGFVQRMDIDVLAFEKQISDTITLLCYLNDSSKRIFEEKWRVSIPEFTEQSVKSFVENNGGLIITTICIDPNSTFVDFFVESRSGIYYRCRLGKEEKGIFLEIDRRYPFYYELIYGYNSNATLDAFFGGVS